MLPDKMGRGFARILSTGWFRVAIVRLSTGGVIMYRVSAKMNPHPSRISSAGTMYVLPAVRARLAAAHK